MLGAIYHLHDTLNTPQAASRCRLDNSTLHSGEHVREAFKWRSATLRVARHLARSIISVNRTQIGATRGWGLEAVSRKSYD